MIEDDAWNVIKDAFEPTTNSLRILEVEAVGGENHLDATQILQKVQDVSGTKIRVVNANS